jgi:hypothetical protein
VSAARGLTMIRNLLLVDNLSAAHGRERYRGRRLVLVAMGNPRRRVSPA